jgi:hypothetical protein
MKKELIKDQKLNTLIQKMNRRGVMVSSRQVEGKLKIKKVRKYKTEWSWAPFFHEVDIIFEGKIYASIGGQSDWLSCEILSKNGISKIKLNKFFRRKLEDSVESFCELVGLDVKSYGSIKIKNIIWN